MAKVHTHAPWRKAILIPCWCIQLFFVTIFIVVLGLGLDILVSYNDTITEKTRVNTGNVSDTEHIVHVATNVLLPVWITLCAICLILTITEIILLARHKLRPLPFLIMNVIKTAIWTALFILDIISAATEGGRTKSISGIVIDAILLLSFWIPLIYGGVVYHRFRRGKSSYDNLDHPKAPLIDSSYESRFPDAYVPTTRDPYRGAETDREDIEMPRGLSFNHESDMMYNAYGRTGFSAQQPVTAAFQTPELGALSSGGDTITSVYAKHLDGEAFEMESRMA